MRYGSIPRWKHLRPLRVKAVRSRDLSARQSSGLTPRFQAFPRTAWTLAVECHFGDMDRRSRGRLRRRKADTRTPFRRIEVFCFRLRSTPCLSPFLFDKNFRGLARSAIRRVDSWCNSTPWPRGRRASDPRLHQRHTGLSIRSAPERLEWWSGTVTFQASPMIISARIISQPGSISSALWPIRAERGNAW